MDSGSDGTRLIIIGGLGRRRSSFRRFGFFFPQKRETKKKLVMDLLYGCPATLEERGWGRARSEGVGRRDRDKDKRGANGNIERVDGQPRIPCWEKVKETI